MTEKEGQVFFDKERDGEIKVHISLTAPPAAGMTFPLHEFIRCARKQDAIDKDCHLGDSVILCDEPPKWYSEAEPEDKNYDKVQETKNVMTQHQHNRSVLKMEENKDREFRMRQNVTADAPKAWAFVKK